MIKLSKASRILIAIGALILVIVYFVPAWSIYLIAPQYPEGLSMQIWLYQITGQVDIINGLNHYIGMKHINEEMFPEFSFLVYILGFYILLAVITAITGNRKILFAYLLLSVIGAFAALVDFYKWGYDYGHHLDKTAAIQVPGLSYQPPLIGHKKLLNFDAFSYPDTGGWIIVGVTVLFTTIWFFEWRRYKKTNPMHINKHRTPAIAVASICLMMMACTPKAEKINYGNDNCAECKMIIMDPKFGAEIVTTKGKVFKFDDVHCIAVFLERRGVELTDIHETLFSSYETPHEFINVQQAEFVVSSSFKSPMAGNAAAFKNKSVAAKKSNAIAGSRITNWATLYNILIR